MADRTPTRGDIWLANFGTDPQHPEQAFTRPALVVSDDRLHHPRLGMVIVVPGTSTLRSLAIHVEVEPDVDNGLGQATAFQVEQLRSVSARRLVHRLGVLDDLDVMRVEEILRLTMRL